ncbi:MAG: hypothetical protein IJU55_02690, partial [Selenomonadaceae bacterium]|nr:hypothetical protein [Selenomonadaceae bacterium]
MRNFNFNLQRFVSLVIAEGETHELDGVNYTAVGGETRLNLDAEEKVSGIASGQVQVTLANKENSPGIYFNGGGKSLTVNFQNNDGALIATQNNNGVNRVITLTEGGLTVDGYKITSGPSGFSLSVTTSGMNYKFTPENSATFDVTQDTLIIDSEHLAMTVNNGDETANLEIFGHVQKKFNERTYTLNDDAKMVVDWLNGKTLELQGGNLTDFFSDSMTLTENCNFKTNNEKISAVLSTAGDYIVNQMAVTTTSDNITVIPSDYNAIKTADGMTYQALDGNVKIILNDGRTSVSGGKVNLNLDDFENVFGFDLTDGGISYGNGKFIIESGSKSYLNQGTFPTEFIAQNDFSVQLTKKDDGLYSFTLPDGSADFSVVTGGNTLLSTSLTLNGEI